MRHSNNSNCIHLKNTQIVSMIKELWKTINRIIRCLIQYLFISRRKYLFSTKLYFIESTLFSSQKSQYKEPASNFFLVLSIESQSSRRLKKEKWLGLFLLVSMDSKICRGLNCPLNCESQDHRETDWVGAGNRRHSCNILTTEQLQPDTHCNVMLREYKKLKLKMIEMSISWNTIK